METMYYTESEAKDVAARILGALSPDKNQATVIGFSGDLGAGKTTLVQAIGQLLGVKETIQSPTFVIAKFYPATAGNFAQLIHIDAYRIDNPQELETLHFSNMIATPNTLVVVEWPELVQELLPKHTRRFAIEHDGNRRMIRHG